jgi:hypothetical protein
MAALVEGGPEPINGDLRMEGARPIFGQTG